MKQTIKTSLGNGRNAQDISIRITEKRIIIRTDKANEDEPEIMLYVEDGKLVLDVETSKANVQKRENEIFGTRLHVITFD